METTKSKQLIVAITADQHTALKKHAADRGVSMSELVREAVSSMTAETISTRYEPQKETR